MSTKFDNNLVEALSVVMNIVYDKQGVQMLDQLLSQTKGGRDTEHGVIQAVAMVASQILKKVQAKIQGLSEEQMYGDHGLVHGTLSSLFEIAQGLGYKVVQSQDTLKEAYQLVEQALEEGSETAPDNEQAEAATPVAPPQQQGPQQAPGGLFGGMQ